MSTNAALQDLDFDFVVGDGIPLESWYHRLQMVLFIELARWRMLELGHRDFFLNGDMFLYYSLDQARAVAEEERQLALFESGLRPDKPKKIAYRGPDVMLVKEALTHKREVWKVWEEGDRYPDLILELLSPSTAAADYGEKKRLYQDVFKTSEYFLYTPDSETVDGFRLLDNAYQKIPRSPQSRIWSRELQVEVGVWFGEYDGQKARWLRLFYPDGSLVPTNDERARQERRAKEAAELRAEQESQRAGQERREKEAAELRVEQESLRAEQERQRADQERREKEATQIENARLRARLADLVGRDEGSI
jgi:Uma2 family endonuclease